MAKFYVNGIGLCYGDKTLTDFLAEAMPDSARAGDVPAADLKSLLPGLNLRRISRSARQALLAASQALLAGSPEMRPPLPEMIAPEVGLYIGSSLGAVENNFAFMDSILENGAQLASPTLFSHSVNNIYCAILSQNLNIQGPSCTVCQFGLSFAGAFQAALSALWAGEIKYALLGAVEQTSEKMNLVKANARQAGLFSAAAEDCSAFFLLSAQPSGPALSFPRWLDAETDEEAADSLPAYCRRFYAGHPAEQALDLAVACSLCSIKTTARDACPDSFLTCRTLDQARGMGAEIRLSF